MPHLTQAVKITEAGRGLWQWCNTLSLDAALIAVVWQQWLHPTGIAPALVLGLCVWLIYSADHLLDARKLPANKRLTARHRFAAEHSRLLVAVWFVTLVVAFVLALHGLSRQQFANGCVLLLLSAAYIACAHLRQQSTPKELLVAILFVTGAAVFQLGTLPLPQLLAPALGLLLLAFANCSLIAQKESCTDARMGFDSLANRQPSSRTCAHFALLAAALIGCISVLLGLGFQLLALSLCASALLALEYQMEHIGQELFHQIADAALLLPALWLLG